MSYIYEVLCEMKNYECEENQRGLELWQSLYTNDGLKSTWKATYTEWLNELAEMNSIPPGIFRNFWIQDALGESDEDLELIDRWFKPEEEDDNDSVCFRVEHDYDEKECSDACPYKHPLKN
jgi:hypothetical protein